MKDKVVVITGASRGLGKAIAQTLASKGAKVIISGREKMIIESQKASARKFGLKPGLIEEIFKLIFINSREIQKK